MKFLVIIPIILLLISIVWLTSSRRRQRRFVLPIAVITVMFVVILPLGINLGLWGLASLVPPDSGELADEIVVLGRGNYLRASRIAEAWNLWRSNRAPEIFASGMSDARLMVRELEDMGIPEQRLSGEECSQTTQENALFTSAFLGDRGVKKIVLLTDSAHMLRSLLTFRSFGFQVIPHPTPEIARYRLYHKLGDLLRESVGLIKYALTGQFSPRSPDISNNPPAEVIRKIIDWRCQV